MSLIKELFRLLKLSSEELNENCLKLKENYNNSINNYRSFLERDEIIYEPEVLNFKKLSNNLIKQTHPFIYKKINKNCYLEIKNNKNHLISIIKKVDATVKKHNNDYLLNKEIKTISSAMDEAKEYFDNDNKYVDPVDVLNWKTKYKELYEKKPLRRYSVESNYNDYYTLNSKFKNYYSNLEFHKKEHNKKFLKVNIPLAYKLIGPVENHNLDENQMGSLLKDVQNHLIIAGAGTGKTTTIVGKIKYLLKSNSCNPEDILVLSFTNASATEMKERIYKETQKPIDASTFHKFGLDIISHVEGKKPSITNINLRNLIQQQIQIKCKDEEYKRKLALYLLNNNSIDRDEFSFKTKKEYDEYIRNNPYETIKGETVKSYGEIEIANFLFENNINYVYEEKYKYDVADLNHSQYRPDFYLPDYDLYIEFFGIDRNKNVAPFFKNKGEKTAKELYNESIEWKRKTHEEYKTTMIESFYYEEVEGNLLSNLKNNLLCHNVKFKPKSAEELFKETKKDKDKLLKCAIDLFETVINLIKSNDYTIENVRFLASGLINRRKINLTLDIIEPLFNSYNEALIENNEIDFNDMINKATSYIKTGKYKNHYKYVIVDEYQDISKSRFKLLKALRESSNYKIFAVGDDWQSIYRFAGSDIGYILNFGDYWGPTEISKIETTYRFTQKLIDLTSSFVQANPSQIKKHIHGFPSLDLEVFDNIKESNEENLIQSLLAYLRSLPKDSSVFLIGRYSFDLEMLQNAEELDIRYNHTTDLYSVILNDRTDLKMTFLTAHKSKGLQADFVFILNNKNNRLGFPSKITDDAIIKLLLENSDIYPYSEERRLFYVSLTRAKKSAFILTLNRYESCFAKEITEIYRKINNKNKQVHYKQENNGLKCPLCGAKLVRRHSAFGDFYGCSNYSKTGCKYTLDIKK